MSRQRYEANTERHYFIGPRPDVLLPGPTTHNGRTGEQNLPEILLTTTDLPRLVRFIDAAPPDGEVAARFLAREVDRARVVPPTEVPMDVVTMRSQILFRYDNVPQIHEVTLLYPSDMGRYQRKLSVLTPLGAALLGLFEGQVMPFEQEDGRMHSVSVIKVLFQPEANQMYWL